MEPHRIDPTPRIVMMICITVVLVVFAIAGCTIQRARTITERVKVCMKEVDHQVNACKEFGW